MTRTAWAVLLRGVNLGKRNKVAMAELRPALEQAGFTHVKTLLQSGNVVLAAAEPAARISARVSAVVADEFGVTSPSVTVSLGGLQTVIDECTLVDHEKDHSKLFAVFCSEPINAKHLAVWDPRTINHDRISIGARAVYAWWPEGIHKAPPLLPKVEQKWGMTGTARNWNTTLKLRDMVAELERALI